MVRTQWEYRWEELASHAQKRVPTEATVTPPYLLNDLGKDGWEAVSMVPFPGTTVDDGTGRLLVLMKRAVRGEGAETTLKARGAIT